MPMQIQVRGLKETNRFFFRLGPNLNKEIMKNSETFMRETQKSAKLRAPRWTGQLARSIKVFKKGKNQISLIVDSPYGYFQEFGFRPHYVQLSRSTRAGATVADWAASKGISPWKGSIFVSGRPRPFIIPALEMNLSKLPNLLQRGTKNAIQMSKRR